MKGETLHFAQHDIKAGASVEKRFRDVLSLDLKVYGSEIDQLTS
jgi:hypothetical protein